jgi:hypothetical protein
MLGLIDTDLKQTRFYQEVFAEDRQEGRQEEMPATGVEAVAAAVRGIAGVRARAADLPPLAGADRSLDGGAVGFSGAG